MNLLITGDSHVGPLIRGLAALREQGEDFQDIHARILGGGNLLVTPFFRDAGDRAEIVDPKMRKQFKCLPPEPDKYQAVALSMGLWPMPVVHYMIWSKRGLAGAPDGFTPVSRAVYRQTVLYQMRYVLQFIDLLRRSGLHVIVVSPPGLFRDNPAFKSIPPEVVVPLFNAFREDMMAELAARDVEVIDILKGTLDEDGFMLDRFRHPDPDDPHHTNAEYGAEIIRKLDAWRKALPRRGADQVEPA